MVTLIKFPIAVPITDAFQVRMKIAPAPYKKEKSMQKIKTFKLLKNMTDNVPIECNKFGANLLFILTIVSEFSISSLYYKASKVAIFITNEL